MKILVILLAMSACAFAQDARVEELTQGEHLDATALYKAKQQADAAWDKFASGLARKYGKEWSVSEVELDKNFKFVVPKVSPVSQSIGCCIWGSSLPCSITNAVSTATGSSGIVLGN